ncbi:MAG: TrpB-like pyridoxal-phosphate dependent enzyme, partial [Armatimonadetes bacterium]|nr:TrpB-like pyridoxal-phosphate dependent enzyme [Armatimonadota bacterium]
AATTPLLRMYTLGHRFVPPAIHAGGLRYHGDAPLLCALYHHKYVEAAAYSQNAVFEAAVQFARTEGIVPAPEAAHAVKKAVDEALACKREGKARVILFNLSGHGHFDLKAYEEFLAGRLEDFAYPEDAIKKAMAELAAIQP